MSEKQRRDMIEEHVRLRGVTRLPPAENPQHLAWRLSEETRRGGQRRRGMGGSKSSRSRWFARGEGTL